MEFTSVEQRFVKDCILGNEIPLRLSEVLIMGCDSIFCFKNFVGYGNNSYIRRCLFSEYILREENTIHGCLQYEVQKALRKPSRPQIFFSRFACQSTFETNLFVLKSLPFKNMSSFECQL